MFGFRWRRSGEHRSSRRAHATWSRVVLFVGVSAFAFLLALEAGRMGFQPLDHSIVFDAGHRVLSGQRPAVDFAIPAGLVPGLMQAGFFHILGTSWWAYCIHAAAANAAGAAVVFLLLAARSASLALPALLAVATAVVLVPPVGVPFPDAWSCLFACGALLLVDRWSRASGPVRTAAWLGAGTCFCLAFLSKPIPALFVLAPVALVGVRALVGSTRRLTAGALFSGGCALAWLGLALATGSGPRAMWRHFVFDAGAIGSRRLDRILDPATRSAVFGEVLSAWWMPLLLVAAAIAATSRERRSASWRLDAGIAAALASSGVLYALLSFRSSLSTLGWFPLAVGFALTAAPTDFDTRSLPPARRSGWDWRLLLRRGRAEAGAALVLVLAAAHAWHFQVTVNRSRVVNLVPYREVHDGAWSPRGLDYLDLVTPSFSAVTARGLSGVLEFLDRHPGNFYLFGDATILYALSGRPSVGRALWLHPEATIPWQGVTATDAFQDGLIEDLIVHRVRYLVLEGERTQLGVTADELPRVHAWVLRHARPVWAAEGYRILEIDSAVSHRPDSPRDPVPQSDVRLTR